MLSFGRLKNYLLEDQGSVLSPRQWLTTIHYQVAGIQSFLASVGTRHTHDAHIHTRDSITKINLNIKKTKQKILKNIRKFWCIQPSDFFNIYVYFTYVIFLQVPVEAKRIFWNWSCKWLWIAMWVLGMRLWSSARMSSTLNCWAISQPSDLNSARWGIAKTLFVLNILSLSSPSFSPLPSPPPPFLSLSLSLALAHWSQLSAKRIY